jgi:hypothetical protein
MRVVTRAECSAPSCSATSMVMFGITQGPNRFVVEMPIHSHIGAGLTPCTFTGDFVQFGHIAKSQGSFACADGSSGTRTFEEMTMQKVGREFPYHHAATATMTLRYASGCVSKGYFFG